MIEPALGGLAVGSQAEFVSADRRHAWVRVTREPASLLLEAVGNSALRPPYRISVAAERELADLGWQDPDAPAGPRSGAWWRRADSDIAAVKAIETVFDRVYAADVAQLAVRSDVDSDTDPP